MVAQLLISLAFIAMGAAALASIWRDAFDGIWDLASPGRAAPVSAQPAPYSVAAIAGFRPRAALPLTPPLGLRAAA